MSASLRQGIAFGLLKLAGWQLVYQQPPSPKAVVIVYPHTSNWDFVIGVIARAAIALPIHFAAKDSLFRGPFVWLFRALGGLPVNRREPTGLVSRLAREFSSRERFYLAITPEGTRRYTEYWRSGFYRVALMAQVPLALGFIDYVRREIGILGYLSLSGDEAVDLPRIASAYHDRRGKHPALQGPIAFAPKASRAGQSQ